ncbi:hypothetical protein FB446DRAFT_795469, partial [Lentinula raphanica]
PRAVGEDLIKRVKYSLELADTSTPDDTDHRDLVQLLHNIGLAHNPEVESYTEEQYNAFINFHTTTSGTHQIGLLRPKKWCT